MTVMTPALKTNVPNPAQLAKRFAGVTVEEQLVSTEPPTRLAFVTETESTEKPTISLPQPNGNGGAVAYLASGIRVSATVGTNGRDGLDTLRKRVLGRRKGWSPVATMALR